MSIAVIQGVSGGIGLPLAQHILKNTSLKLYALTHKSSTREIEEQLHSIGGGARDRVTVLGNVDLREEGEIEKAAEIIKEREGKGSVRLVSCLAGIVSIHLCFLPYHSYLRLLLLLSDLSISPEALRCLPSTSTHVSSSLSSRLLFTSSPCLSPPLLPSLGSLM